MNNAVSVVFRTTALCSRSKQWPLPIQLFRRWAHSLRELSPQPRSQPVIVPNRPSTCLDSRAVLASRICRVFSTSPRAARLKPYDEFNEQGLTFRKKPLDANELFAVYGPTDLDADTANRILRVLHARRVDGTLDIPYDHAVAAAFEQNEGISDAAIEWLRANYPIDEEDAILRRFSREEAPREQEHPSALVERGQRYGLYKTQDETQARDPTFQARRRQTEASSKAETTQEAGEYYGPQSGRYYAQLSEDQSDPSGQSRLAKIRARNLAREEQEEREYQEQVEKSIAEAEARATERSKALEARKEQGLEVSDGAAEVRPPNEFEKWIIKARTRAASDLTLDSPGVQNLTTAGRLLPAFLFVASALTLLYWYTQYWEPPRRSDRWLPNQSLAYATCIGIAGINVLVFLLWRFPPMLRIMNRYFIVTPGYPYTFSLAGNIFSHISFRHLFWNMVSLAIFGPTLHEEVGRANFLAIYLGAGLFGSLMSFTLYILRGILYSSSLGASGCLWGTMSAYFWSHRKDEFVWFFVPSEYRNTLTYAGESILIALIILDVASSWWRRGVDITAHLGGMLYGVLCMQCIEQNRPRTGSGPPSFGTIFKTDISRGDKGR